MKAMMILKYEHQAILLMIGAAESEAFSISETGKIDVQTVRKIADYFKKFVDRCHHVKEEKHLFALLSEHGMPTDTGLLAVMLHEHEQGRAFVREIAAVVAGDSTPDAVAIRKTKENLSAYAKLLRAHIEKEDDILYPMADKLLKPADHKSLAKAFKRVDSKGIGKRMHEEYLAWIESLIDE